MENKHSVQKLVSDLSFGLDDDKLDEQSVKDESCSHHEMSGAQSSAEPQYADEAFPAEVVEMIPDWIRFEEESEEGVEEAPAARLILKRNSSQVVVASPLEALGTDVTANLLACLTLTEIASASLVSKGLYHACRSEQLWKSKFMARWNADWVSTSSWFQAYQTAYENTHDLWMTHWNIVPPEDGDAPGRCCIRSNSKNGEGERSCPLCRYMDLSSLLDKQTSIDRADVYQAEIDAVALALALEDGEVSKSRVIQASARYSIAKWLYHTGQLPRTQISSRSAKRAFRSAATFHRCIDTRQYEANSLHFMTDAVFFNVCDSFLDPGMKEEIEQVRHEIYGKNAEDVTCPGADDAISHLGPYFELTQHTWHIVKFSNPDFVRPLTFRNLVQRPDCFSVYPSEGYLEPGESCYVYFGVRLLGGLMNQAMEALNVQREEVDPFLADVYAHEAHLPYAPFCIRYMFSAVAPCIPPLFASRGVMKERQGVPRSSTFRKYKDVVSYLWENVATEATVRTQYISAHVNANYSYNEFCLDALQPFDICTSANWGELPKSCPLVHIAPNLMHRFPTVFERQQNLRLEMELSDCGIAYRTEHDCLACGKDWGPRAEELGRRFVLQILTCIAQDRERKLEMQNFVTLLRSLYLVVEKKGPNEDWDEVYRTLFVLHGVLMKNRAMQRVSVRQREVLMVFEVVIDHLCQLVQVHRGFQNSALDDGPMTWRHAGVYSHRRSTDSVFDPLTTARGLTEDVRKDEPDYLDGFRHLCHNPGTYSLGQQQDPNHEDRKIPAHDVHQASLKGALQPRLREKASDVFMDDTTLSFASALAMIHDPRSLIVHGVYDRVFATGTISRRPPMRSPYFTRINEASRDEVRVKALELLRRRGTKSALGQAFRAQSRLTNSSVSLELRVQCNEIDPDGYACALVSEDANGIDLLDDFVRNIPAPGMGRFAFSQLDESAERNDDQIVEFSLLSDGQAEHAGADRGNTANAPVDPFEPENDEGRMNPLLVGPRGPRLFNLFWLLSSHLGWSIQENNGGSPVMVDRRILIASQWVANSAMAMPVLYTLMARSIELISPKPIDYHLEGIPYDLDNEMRFFSPRECAQAAFGIFVLWLVMGRYSERKIGRTFERSMMEHLSNETEESFLQRNFLNPVILWIQRLWDRLCPIFLQRRVFTPRWNRRTYAEITKHIRLWRSKDLREHRSSFDSSDGRGVMTFGASVEDGGPPVSIWEESSMRKFCTGALIALGSFSACSPHFSLNVLTVFCCSIGLGMSVSLQSMETGRGIPSSSSHPPGRSIFRPVGLNTIVIGFFLIGQLVGSSGGVLFLAEFVVTSVSLVLGGAGTISASAMESWGCFFVLSTAAFWGYVFARVALMDGIRHKRRSASGVFLCASLVAVSLLWMLTLLVWKWDVPTTVMILHESLSKRSSRKQVESQLQ